MQAVLVSFRNEISIAKKDDSAAAGGTVTSVHDSLPNEALAASAHG